MATNNPTFEDRLAALEGRIGSLTLADLPLGPLQRKLESDWQPDSAVLLQPHSITSDQLQTNLLPVAGKAIATMAAIGAGAVAGQALTGLPFGGGTPRLVIAQFTTGGIIFFSDQYVIGTHTYAANGFSVEYRSAAAIGAPWTIGVNYIAYF